VNGETRALLRRIDRQFDALRAMPEPIPARERYKHTVESLAKGGYLRFRGELYRVDDVHTYREKDGSTWEELELLGLISGETRFLEWERDDELEVSWNDRPVKLADIGTTPDEIERIADAESGSIQYAGKTFRYDDDYSAVFLRSGTGEPEPVYFYDFETSDEEWCLTVEEWGDADSGYEYEVYQSEYIEADAIEVLATGGAG
jgi:hypothetical protein